MWYSYYADGRAEPLPPERRCVLLKLDCGQGFHSGAVVVGYLRYAAGEIDCPYFVCSGVRGEWFVTHWCDCLGDDWTAQGWSNIRQRKAIS